jgi:hypothetical protein
MKLKNNRALTILMVMSIASVLIPFRLPPDITYDVCIRMFLPDGSVNYDAKPLCDEEDLYWFAVANGYERCETHPIYFGNRMCYRPKTFMLKEITVPLVKSLVVSLVETNLRWISLEHYRAILSWAS